MRSTGRAGRSCLCTATVRITDISLDLNDVVYFGHSDGGITGLLSAMKTDRISLLLTGGANMTPGAVSDDREGRI